MIEPVQCPSCGSEYKQLGSHWNQSSCNHPKLNDHQKEVITGLLMGDGSIQSQSKNPNLVIGSISENYLHHLDDLFGVLATGVSLYCTAEEGAEKSRKSGFNPDAEAENYSDVYKLRTRKLPELHEFSWYKTGQKEFPEDIDLTPTVLKHWYCGDGSWNNKRGYGYIKITTGNEANNTEKITKIFKNSSLPEPSNYNIWKSSDDDMKCDIQFTVEQSKKLFEYMGSPPPDFEYKWPSEYC